MSLEGYRTNRLIISARPPREPILSVFGWVIVSVMATDNIVNRFQLSDFF